MGTATERPPPYARRSPARGSAQSGYDDRLAPDSTPQHRHPSPTLAYLSGRERVLGRRLVLHREPEVAASLAIEAMGTLGARAWARRLLAEMEVASR